MTDLQPTTGRLTVAQFEAALEAFPRLSSTGKAAARSVLVDGNEQAAVAKYLDISRQQVNRWTRAIYKVHLASIEEAPTERLVVSPALAAVKDALQQRKAGCR